MEAIHNKATSKTLEDGHLLEMSAWTSTMTKPGAQFHALQMTTKCGQVTEKFPVDYENYTRSEISNFFDRIDSAADFKSTKAKNPVRSFCG